MTPTRQAALTAAITVWSVQVSTLAVGPDAPTEILALADRFDQWLTQTAAVTLTLTPSDIRKANPHGQP